MNINPSFVLLFITPLIVSFLLSISLAPLSIKFAKRFGLIDDPHVNKHPKVIHTKPTPRAGVIGIATSIVITSILFLPMDSHIKGILGGVLILTIMGVLDDKYNLSPYLRLAIQLIASAMPIAAGIGIAYLSNPFGGIIDLSQPQLTFYLLGETRTIWLVADVFALLWIMTLINFTNMGAKGVPGQLSGIVGIAAIVVAILSLQFSADIAEWPVIILASITAGAYLGFLPWHIFPQRIMPGFGGSNVAGFLLAVLAILTTTKVGTLIVVLGIPLIDTSYSIMRRIREGKSPVWGDRGHLHHKLLDELHWSQEKVAVFYWSVTAILGAIALNIRAPFKLYTILGVSALLGGSLLWFKNKSK